MACMPHTSACGGSSTHQYPDVLVIVVSLLRVALLNSSGVLPEQVYL